MDAGLGTVVLFFFLVFSPQGHLPLNMWGGGGGMDLVAALRVFGNFVKPLSASGR